MRATAAALLLLAALPVSAPDAFAQAERPLRRLDVSVGGGWLGAGELGTADADLRANAAPPQPLRLFTTDFTLGGASTIEAAAGFAFTRRWAVEGGVQISHPELRASVSADAEGAPPITVAERIDQYVVEGRLVVMLDEVRLGRRTVPFAAAGAGYLRQLHEGQTVVEEGHVFHVGGGVKHWLLARSTGLVRAAGLRLDARLNLFAAGISLADGRRPHGALTIAAFLTL